MPNETKLPPGLDEWLDEHKDLMDDLSKAEDVDHSMMADGGEVSSPTPAGLEEFINTPESQPMVDNSAPIPTSPNADEGYANQVPHGLDQFISQEIKEEKYGSTGQQALAGLEGVGRGLAGFLAPLAEKQLGVKEEDILGREEIYPGTHIAGEVLGLVGPALLTGGGSAAVRAGAEGAGLLATAAKLTQGAAIEKIAAKLAPVAGETLASKIGSAAAKGAIENVLFSGSDEVSRLILNDPNQSAQTAFTDIGLSAALGGILGGGANAASHLWQAKVGDKGSKLVADFTGRVKEHIENPDPVSAMTQELTDYYQGMKEWAHDVHGANGLKAQNIAKVIPEMSEKIASQVSSVSSKVDETLAKLAKDPHASILDDAIGKYKSAVSSDSPVEIFNGMQELKQQLQEWGKYNKATTPLSERPFRNAARELAQELRTSLEDTKVWNKAAEIQTGINKALAGTPKGDIEEGIAKNVGYISALKDFEKKFTAEVAGERVIDPTKINTYLNQLGKPNAELKQEMLKNFLDASEKYKKEITGLHAGVGLDSPITSSSLNVTESTLGKKTLGSKMADIFLSKGLGTAGGHGIAGALGATMGSLLGHGEIGAIIGERALGPFFSSILPAIAKGLVNFGNNSKGFKAAVDYAMAVTKGESLVNKAAKGLFKPGAALLPTHFLPNEREKAKLDKLVEEAIQDPSKMFNAPDQLGHYMPEHGAAVSQTVGTAVQYLRSLKPGVDKPAPLDSKPVPSSAAKARYNNALDIAQQPLTVLDKIQKGTITLNDVKDLMSIYPDLYKRLNQKLTGEMTDHLSKDQSIPYKTRLGLSMFLGQPLDSTMSQQSLQSVMQMSGGPLKQVTQQPHQGRSPGGVKSAPALQKMPGLYQTPEQARIHQKTK